MLLYIHIYTHQVPVPIALWPGRRIVRGRPLRYSQDAGMGESMVSDERCSLGVAIVEGVHGMAGAGGSTRVQSPRDGGT